MPAAEPPLPGGGPAGAPAPERVEEKLTELLDLAALALDCWQREDLRAALEAVGRLMPVAAAAATGLDVLVRLGDAERDRLAAEEEERKRRAANPSDWLG